VEGDWLQEYLEEAVRRHLCTKIGCTTCGAAEFRDGLSARLREHSEQKEWPVFNQEHGVALLKALAQVTPVGDSRERTDFEKATRCVLFDLSQSFVLTSSEGDLMLEGSWAGEVLKRMRAHYESRLAAQQRHEELNDPVGAQKRRDEKKRLRREKHEMRLALKKERDRIWFEQHPKFEKPGHRSSGI